MVRSVAPVCGLMVSTRPGSPMATWTRARRRIEEGHIRHASYRPDVGDFAVVAINLDQRTVVASGIETLAPMIDVEAMGATQWQFPMDDIAEIGKPGDQYHRRLADAEVYPLGVGIGHAPAWPSRQINRALRGVRQIDDLQHRALMRVADARGDADAHSSDDDGAVGPWPRWECGFEFVGRGVQPGDCRGTAIGGQDLAVIGDRTRDTRKPRQCRDMLLPVVVDDLDAIALGVRDEDAPGFWVERGVVEVAARSVRYFDNAKRFQRHGSFSLPDRKTN
jgi:hypothetical protein